MKRGIINLSFLKIIQYCYLYIFVEMNSYQAHLPGPEIRQSDDILKKLNEIKNAIEGRKDREQSPSNLNNYLPQQRISTNTYQQARGGRESNPQSYRYSLEKKLERLFKEERKVYNQSQQYIKPNENQSLENMETFGRREASNVFTIQHMEHKIKQLERKYLHTAFPTEEKKNDKKKSKQNEHSQQQYRQADRCCKNQSYKKQYINETTPQKRTKSFIDQPSNAKNKDRKKIVQFQNVQQKSDIKLLAEIGTLKRQVKQIKQSNVQLNEKLTNKEQERKYKKQRSRYLLGCILAKLMQIQQQVRRRDKKEEQGQRPKETKVKTAAQQRESLKKQNTQLIRHVEQLNKQLRKQESEKERAQERSNWIEAELRKLNRL